MNNWTLIILAAMAVIVVIMLVRRSSGSKETDVTQVSNANQAGPASAPVAAAQPPSLETGNAELVAAICAAIAASTGQQTDGFVVRRISRVSGHTPAWAIAGRQECIDTRRV